MDGRLTFVSRSRQRLTQLYPTFLCLFKIPACPSSNMCLREESNDVALLQIYSENSRVDCRYLLGYG